MATRTRSRSTSFTRSVMCQEWRYLPRWPDTNWKREYTWSTSSGTQSQEQIIDQTGPRVGTVNRPVDHTRTVSRCWPVNYELNQAYAGTATDFQGSYLLFSQRRIVGRTWPKYMTEAASKPGMFGSAPENSTTWFSREFSSRLEQIPTTYSVPNFLLDIRDVPETLATLKSLRSLNLRSISDLYASLKTPRGRNAVLDRFGDNATNWRLAWEFGVKPMISDVKNFISSTERVRKRIAHLKATRGKTTEIKMSRKFDHVCSPPMVWEGQSGEITAMWDQAEASTTYAFGAMVKHNITGLDDVNRQWGAYFADAGFNKPLSVIYDAIPFSFLVDYVSNVGDLVEAADKAFSVQPFEGRYTVLDGWSSIKVLRRASYSGKVLSTGEFLGSLGTVSDMSYKRIVGIPTTQGLVFDKPMSGNQAINILALIRQSF